MGLLDFLKDKKITTFEQAQSEAMRRAREADLDEFDAEALLRRILRQNNIAIPESMAKTQDPSGRINPDAGRRRLEGGTVKKTKKAQMMKGGMANGKAHMYSAGGSVTDNAGLRALRASGPKGRAAYNKIVNS
tara:strand:- start:399 stop:797 length:399 start_codon:yes stop_codon:yes gene_type:complete